MTLLLGQSLKKRHFVGGAGVEGRLEEARWPGGACPGRVCREGARWCLEGRSVSPMLCGAPWEGSFVSEGEPPRI